MTWRSPVKKINRVSLAVDGTSPIHEDAQLLESPERVSADAPRVVFTDGTVETAGRGRRTRSSARSDDYVATFA
jgi:hypothetical protein